MKTLLAVCGTLTLLLASVSAESPAEREFKQLKEQRDAAVASATKAVDVRYQASLEQLLARAMQAHDDAATEKVKAELTTLGPLKPTPFALSTPPPTAKLPSTVLGSWKISDASGWTAIYEFRADGTCAITPGAAKVPDKIVPVTKAGSKLELKLPDGKVQAFDLPKAGRLEGFYQDGAKLGGTKLR